MTHTPLIDTSGTFISKWEEWSRPKRSYQWKAGRSAMELARAWFRTPKSCCPDEVRALLDSHADIRGVTLKTGRPEYVTPLPERGEGRHHDLWLRGDGLNGRITVCIEAKADESFGERLAKQLQVARKRQPNTAAPERARALLHLLFGRDCNPEAAPWRELRYQLITAAAGTALQAGIDGSVAAVLIVHEFHSSLTAPVRLAANQADLDAFVALLSPGTTTVTAGQLIGPIQLPAPPLRPRGLALYIGKAVTELGSV
ncbi:MAG: hypothetical protein SGJ01_05455 [Gemmatimonadota bacterium]|nr:hypothetical protein [Gemmatimonadota bacterium]